MFGLVSGHCLKSISYRPVSNVPGQNSLCVLYSSEYPNMGDSPSESPDIVLVIGDVEGPIRGDIVAELRTRAEVSYSPKSTHGLEKMYTTKQKALVNLVRRKRFHDVKSRKQRSDKHMPI